MYVFFGLALLVRFYLFFSVGYTADDALITFRYAENLASGQGFVYNPGERILGTTTPLFTLLLAFLLRLKLSVFTAAFLISSVSDLFSARALLALFKERRPPLAFLPALIFLFNPETLRWSLSGMETQLYVAFILNALVDSSRERWKRAFVLGALATLTRIDGSAVLGSLIVCYIIRFRKFPVKESLLAGACLLPWILFALIYFGSPIPNSAGAKWALAGGHLLASGWEIFAKGFLHLHTYGLLFFLLAIYGTVKMIRDTRGLAIAIWTWGYAISYTFAGGPMHAWYYAPFYAGYLILIFNGIFALQDRVALLHRQSSNNLGMVLTMIIILLLSYRESVMIAEEQRHLDAVNKATGIWLQQNTPVDADVAIKDIGSIGYYSKRSVLDLAGLVSPQCIPFRARNDFLGPIRKFRPAYFAFSSGQARSLGLDHSDLLNGYRPVETIQSRYGTYIIYGKSIK